MALKNIDEKPKITDTVRFLIETPDVDGCVSEDPFKVDNLKIFYVERSFISNNHGEYERVNYDEELLNNLKIAQEVACDDPTAKNLFEVDRLQTELDSKSQKNKFFYKDAVLVDQIGDPLEPAWLSTDTENALITKIEEDAEGNPIYGNFIFDWNPRSKVREGDFFICWTWTPNPAGESLSAHTSFTLWGDGKAVQTLPTHITPDDKYATLLERYLPEMYKGYLTDNDITPDVTDKLNQSIADGFTFVENYANQLIDLYDANVLHESMLIYLSNLFNLKLKSDDPTLWRRQIKEAVPLFKKKGTLEGLEEAFAQSGMTLEKYTELWQVVSPYFWEQSFLVKDSATFKLDKIPLSNHDDFDLYLRSDGSNEYTEVAINNVEFYEDDCEWYMNWVGGEISGGLPLYENDIVRIKYQYKEIPSGQESIENYRQSLSIADSRDETEAEFPPKNWNVRLIEEDDPMFEVIVPVRHPFHDDIIFGQIRTEFPYSENIYNMEEYNGSTRDSFDVCFIDKAFRDPCGNCASSKYNIDIGIENISDDRLVEVYDVLDEYTPFTAVPHRINFSGDIVDFVNPPVEHVDMLVQYNIEQNILSGSSNPFFHRVMEDGLTNWVVDREDLASQTIVLENQTATGFNTNVGFISPNVNLGGLGLILNNHVLEVLSPSPNSGVYSLESVDKETGFLGSSVIEPLNTEGFTFRLSNIVYESLNAEIYQENCATLSDKNNSLSVLGVKSNWDIANTPDYTGGAWKVSFPSLSIELTVDRVEENTLYFECNSPFSPGFYLYIIFDDNDNEIFSSSAGIFSSMKRGRVHITDPDGIDITDIVRHGDFMSYDGNEYLVDELRINNDLIINDYTIGNSIGVPVKFLRRLADKETGYFLYQGIEMVTSVDHEVGFGIQNGSGSPVTDPNLLLDNSDFKENYLVRVDDNYYKIADIDSTRITLSGLPQEWGTLIAGGTAISYDILHFEKDTVEAQFVVFDQLDRSGKDPVLREIESTITNDVAIVALSTNSSGNGNGTEDMVVQEEGVSFEIEYLNGDTEQGEL